MFEREPTAAQRYADITDGNGVWFIAICLTPITNSRDFWGKSFLQLLRVSGFHTEYRI